MDDLLQELQMLRESLAEKSGNRVLFSETCPANVAVIEAVVRSCCQLDRRVQLIAKAIERRYTLDEAAGQLGVTLDVVQKHLADCAPGFNGRNPHHLTHAELDCIARKLK